MARLRTPDETVRFGVFELDARAGELRKHGIRIRLQEQPFQVLQILLEKPGEVVTREELQARLWPEHTFVEFDKGIYNAIKRLRETLGDSAENPRFVETLAKRGYRFIGEVSQLAPGNGHSDSAATSERKALPGRRRSAPVWLLAPVVAVTFSVVLLSIPRFRERVLNWQTVPRIRSLAVLPLTNLSSDASQQYFSDGLTDALITELAHISAIKVVSRTSVMPYRNASKPVSRIAAELGVDGIVEGAVQRFEDRIRITAQLIYAPADQHVWAKTYERDSQNVLGLQQDVAQDIAQEIQAKLTPAEKARFARTRPVSLRAMQAYLQGRYHSEQADHLMWRNGSAKAEHEQLEVARGFFQQALREDPSYAHAYVGLGRTWLNQPVAEKGPENSEAMLRRALELDPDLAEAHEALATLDVLRLWRWSEAEREYKRAIELNPNFANAHARYAEYLDMMLRFDEGMKEFLHAQELDPGHDFNPNPFWRRRQYNRAIEMDENDVKRHAFGFWSHANLGYDYDAAGRHDEAAQEWEEVIRMLGFRELADAMRTGLRQSGYRGSLRALAAGMEAGDRGGQPPPANFAAMVYGILGEKDRAFEWLERGYRERSQAYSALNVDPCWDSLREDPRFKDLVRRMNFPR